ncbi:hypothetical protein L6452_15439 [Arctium lappa]|uniref:Uncharacterized protein n=1 Tax=Arctium lappa TaxID=4217 RepID=A0ACB9CNV4_ARCLA|nr:hypothetical protein L6452_15439 [Arctium lappa]
MDDFKFWEWSGTDFRFVGPTLPIDQSNNILMGEFCRRAVSTIWHYHGGCVVDHNLKVVGVHSLRVVDGSTFTVSPGTNPQATLLMFGMRALATTILSLYLFLENPPPIFPLSLSFLQSLKIKIFNLSSKLSLLL